MSEAKKADSVYDVLYADTRRISSILSQFSDDGLLTELTRAAEESSQNELTLSVKVVKTDTRESGKTSNTRRFDPQWLLPLMFLDKASPMIRRDVEEAPVGSLALATGKLVVTDLSALQEMWKSAAMRKQILKGMLGGNEATGNRHDRRSGKIQRQDTTEQEAILELLPHLPHSPQMNIVTEDYAVWSTIQPEYLVGSVSDLILKHGVKVSGVWSMVGVIDARPFDGDNADEEVLSPMEMIRLGILQESMWKVAHDIAGPTRQALGRPLLSYGMTPLIIFREILQ